MGMLVQGQGAGKACAQEMTDIGEKKLLLEDIFRNSALSLIRCASLTLLRRKKWYK